LSPVSIIFGQSFMLEASLTLFTVAALYANGRWLNGGGNAWLGVLALSTCLAFLTKVYMLVLLLPLGVEAAVLLPRQDRAEMNRSRSRRLAALIALIFAVLPAAAWYWHVAQASSPDGPFADRIFYSVRQSAQVHRPPHPLLTTPDFYRRILDDLAGIVLTPLGFTVALAGLLHCAWPRYGAWLAAMVLLIVGLPLKFYEMNYYWLPVLPVLCVMAGLGWQEVYRRLRPRPAAIAVFLLVASLISLRYALKPAFVTPPEDRGVVAAGQAIQQLADSDEPVVTMHGTAIDLLYYCRRPGWVVSPEDPNLPVLLAKLHTQGARWVVYAGPAGTPRGLERLPVRAAGHGFKVFDLRGCSAVKASPGNGRKTSRRS
jgi:4-amino-4-deoxy-L-arabinose transferase-like glycosyltransferase